MINCTHTPSHIRRWTMMQPIFPLSVRDARLWSQSIILIVPCIMMPGKRHFCHFTLIVTTLYVWSPQWSPMFSITRLVHFLIQRHYAPYPFNYWWWSPLCNIVVITLYLIIFSLVFLFLPSHSFTIFCALFWCNKVPQGLMLVTPFVIITAISGDIGFT